jgi:O-antigen/teichoic acid export membrane protein
MYAAFNGIASLLLTLSGAVFFRTLTATLVAYTIGSATAVVVATRYAPRRLNSRSVSWREVTGLLHESWPLGCVAMSNSINANIPRYVVAASLGTSALGVFALCTTAASTLTLPAGSVTQAVMPWLRARHHAGGKAKLRAASRPFAIVCALLSAVTGLVVLATSGYIADLIGLERSPMVSMTLVILATGAGVSYVLWLLNAMVMIAGLQKRQFHAYLAVTALHVVVTAGLTFSFGLVGAALGVLICGIIQSTASWRVLKA